MITTLQDFQLLEHLQAPLQVYHVSSRPILALTSRPMWFSLDAEKGKTYWSNAKSWGDAYLYSGTATGQYLTEQELRKELARMGADYDHFRSDMTTNPKEAFLRQHPLFCELAAHYDGFQHSDYDPADHQKSIIVLLCSNPAASVAGWTLLQESKYKPPKMQPW